MEFFVEQIENLKTNQQQQINGVETNIKNLKDLKVDSCSFEES